MRRESVVFCMKGKLVVLLFDMKWLQGSERLTDKL